MGSSTPGGARREAMCVAAGLAAVYLLTLTGNHREAEDAVTYAADIRGGAADQVLNANHLAWGALGWLVFNAVKAIGVGDTALPALQAMDAVIGALGAGVLWWFLRSIGWGRRETAGAAGLLAFSYGYWYFSGEAEVYILSAAALIVCLAAAHRASTAPSARAYALLGLANGVAVLAHNTNALFVIVAAVALLHARERARGRRLAVHAAAYAGVVLAVVVPAYVGSATAVGVSDAGELREWTTGYATNDRWGKLEASSVPEAVGGGGRALVGGHSVFALSDDALGVDNPRAQRYLMRDYPEWLAIVLLGLGILVGVAVLAGLVISLRRGAGPGDPDTVLVRLSLAWLIPYALFFLWWEPQNAEFWIAVWVPLAILSARGLSAGPAPRWALPAVVGGLALVNLAGSIVPQLDPDDDYWRARAEWYERNARPGDLVVANGYVITNYIRYFGRTQALDAQAVFGDHPASPAHGVIAVKGVLATTDPTRILISRQAFDPAGDAFSSCEGNDECPVARALATEFRARARVIGRSALETVWTVPPEPDIKLPPGDDDVPQAPRG